MGHKERIEVPGSEVFGPYSPGVKSHGIVWLAGQIAPEAGDDIASQTDPSLPKVAALPHPAGLSKDDIYFAQVLLGDIDDFQAMNEVYAGWIGESEVPPARAAFAAAALPAGAKVGVVVQAIDANHE